MRELSSWYSFCLQFQEQFVYLLAIFVLVFCQLSTVKNRTLNLKHRKAEEFAKTTIVLKRNNVELIWTPFVYDRLMN